MSRQGIRRRRFHVDRAPSGGLSKPRRRSLDDVGGGGAFGPERNAKRSLRRMPKAISAQPGGEISGPCSGHFTPVETHVLHAFQLLPISPYSSYLITSNCPCHQRKPTYRDSVPITIVDRREDILFENIFLQRFLAFVFVCLDYFVIEAWRNYSTHGLRLGRNFVKM